MTSLQNVSTIIHEIRELDRAIERFRTDADERSQDVIFDFAAITQWGSELVKRLSQLEHTDVPAPKSGYEASDPVYKAAISRARRLHADAQTIGRDLAVCLHAIETLDDQAVLWSAIPHLEAELDELERILTGFSKRLASATPASDS